MDPDSLDWIWEDFHSHNLGEGDEEFKDDYDSNESCSNGKSDCDSESDIGCWLSIGDEKTALELKELVKEVERRYEGEVFDDQCESESNTVKILGDDDRFFKNASETAKNNLSEIHRIWTNTLYWCITNEKNVPGSYTKTTNIEKLVFLYVDIFIEQFKVKYPNRRQLVLVHLNECNVQKCICTTIKPSRLVYHDLIDSASYSEFVAKHITYTKIDDPVIVPQRIVSPSIVLEMQTANCFELSTLLVSFLIGCGYNAFVIQGYATESVCNNDLRNIKLDLPKTNDEEGFKSENNESLNDAYSIQPMMDSCSDYINFLVEEKRNKTVIQNEAKEDESSYSSDPLYGKRVHSWVLIMPLEMDKKKKDHTNKDFYFIEPSTGERKDISDDNYIGIEAIWNHTNYWVNLQPLEGGCTQYNFILTNTNYWENFLSKEPYNLRDISVDSKHTESQISRHLAMPNSWVTILEVSRKKYHMLYPSGKKIVSYMNALKEYYADYIMPDGLIEKTTFYADSDYTNKLFVKEIYKHRLDKLISVDMKYTSNDVEIVEYFSSGREDCIKSHTFYGDNNGINAKRLIKFYNLRLDSMIELKIDELRFVTVFDDRPDLLFWRMCMFGQPDNKNINILNMKRKPKVITEKFLRNKSIHKDRDIATRHFNIESNNIYVQYQYGEGQITQSSRLFKKPPVTSEEFDFKLITENIVYQYEGHLKSHEAYRLLLDMIKAENDALSNVSKLEDAVIEMLETRRREQLEFKLNVDSLDWDRNRKIRNLLKQKKDKHLALAKRLTVKQMEYALPYYETIKRPFIHDVAEKIRDKIIIDFKNTTETQFIRVEKLFSKKQFMLHKIIKTIKLDNFKELKFKNKIIILCSSLINELDILMVKMERYEETHFKRYNNLASYLNSNPDFKMLTPLKLFESI